MREISLSVRNLVKHFDVNAGFGRGRAVVRAVDDVSFEVEKGRTLAIVGESGCGKTTVSRLVLQLETPTAGEIFFEGVDLAKISRRTLREFRRRIGVIFQDPFSSLNPRITAGQMLAEPLMVHKQVRNRAEADERVSELLNRVGLPQYMSERYPHQLSGGQRQRLGIARALTLNPSLIVCDEPVSALDVSIQAQIINLLTDLQQQFGLTYLFIAHDLAVVRHIAQRVAVMYLGHIMESADRADLYEHPLHPYSKALLSAAPVPDPERARAHAAQIMGSDLPSPLNPPRGCVFNTRCPLASEECRQTIPPLREVAPNHHVACIKV